jgi:hypothetical protein
MLNLVLCKASLLHCISLIKAFRAYSYRPDYALTYGDKPAAKVAAFYRQVALLTDRTDLDVFSRRLALYSLSEAADELQLGALRLNTQSRNAIIRERGIDKPSAVEDQQLKQQLRLARILFKVCLGFGPGLLCLLPPDDDRVRTGHRHDQLCSPQPPLSQQAERASPSMTRCIELGGWRATPQHAKSTANMSSLRAPWPRNTRSLRIVILLPT